LLQIIRCIAFAPPIPAPFARGNQSAIKWQMIAITTNNSIKVKPAERRRAASS